MCSVHFVVSISKKVRLQLTFESVETQFWITKAANAKSTGPQQQNANDRNHSVDSAVRSTSAEWQSADVDDQ